MQTSSNSSVRFDMAPSPALTPGRMDKSGILGVLWIQSLNCRLPNDVQKYFEITATEEFSVKDVVSAIQENGYEKYDFNNIGIGCRCWVSKMLERLKGKELIGSFSEVIPALSKAWEANVELPHGVSVEKGTFHG